MLVKSWSDMEYLSLSGFLIFSSCWFQLSCAWYMILDILMNVALIWFRCCINPSRIWHILTGLLSLVDSRCLTFEEIGRKVLFGGVVCEWSDFVVSSDSFDLLSMEYQDLAVNVLAWRWRSGASLLFSRYSLRDTFLGIIPAPSLNSIPGCALLS